MDGGARAAVAHGIPRPVEGAARPRQHRQRRGLSEPQQARRDARRAHSRCREDRRIEMSPIGGIEASGLGQAMRQWLWLYPAVETLHITGIALLFGSIAVLDLRLLGFSRQLSARKLSMHVLPWTAASFLLIIPSGLAMFTAHAGEFIDNPVFAVKMGLIMAGGINAALFHTTVLRSADVWDSEEMRKLPP